MRDSYYLRRCPVVLWAVLLTFPVCAFAFELESAFRAPIRLQVWQHWQASWNVELEEQQNVQFELQRGKAQSGLPEIRLKLIHTALHPGAKTAKVYCSAYRRTDTWNVAEHTHAPLESTSLGNDFIFENAWPCADSLGENIVTNIRVEVFAANGRLLEYSVRPMYVRGRKAAYWNNPIDPFSAHGGQGGINVATAISGESGWDRWDGVLVRPVLSFVDRNTLTAQTKIGLHRHEANQELYFIERGKANMIAGVAARASGDENVERLWSSDGSRRWTKQFAAAGGWLETRILEAGELAVIVPNPAAGDTVYFHGIEAIEPTTFWTMGTKN